MGEDRTSTGWRCKHCGTREFEEVGLACGHVGLEEMPWADDLEARAERAEAELREAREALRDLLDVQFSSNATEIGQAVDRARGALENDKERGRE